MKLMRLLQPRFLNQLSITTRKYQVAMNKTRLNAQRLLQQRVEKKSKTSDLNTNHAELTIIGSEECGFSSSLLVMSEGEKYLFNCSEGLQRVAYANKTRFINLENVFVTNLDWTRISGLYGFSMTLQDIGTPALTVHATEPIKDFFNSTKHFTVYNSGIKINTKDVSKGDYSDGRIHIKPILLDANSFSNRSEGLSPDSSPKPKKLKARPRLVAYVCTFPDLPGALMAAKCKEFGVPIGPDLAKLKSGVDVTLKNGTIVKASDVCAPRNLGSRFLVVECPSPKEIELLTSNQTLNELIGARKNNTTERRIELAVHFAPNDVVNCPEYKNWMDSFPTNCKHLLMAQSESYTRPNFIDAYRHQYFLNSLDPVMFPQLRLTEHQQDKIKDEREAKEKSAAQNSDGPVGSDAGLALSSLPSELVDMATVKCELNELEKSVPAIPFARYLFRPQRIVEIPDQSIDIEEKCREAKLEKGFGEEVNILREKQAKLPVAQDYEPEVVFLGTGSAVPGKYRCTSFILLNFNQPKQYSVILDCGEDSLGQLERFYGLEERNRILKRLRMIYVSHHHLDHHTGMIRIIRERRKYTNEPVLLLLPPTMKEFLNYCNNNFEDLSDYYKIVWTNEIKRMSTYNVDPIGNERDGTKRIVYEMMDGLLDDIQIVEVKHCVFSCAVVMKFNIGHKDMKTFKVGYSGDARPNKDFINQGQGCDLLIHEATFDSRLQEDAESKKHSTTKEAIDVGRQMKAKFTILTHFSSRHAKIPILTDDFHDKIGFAFDNMAIRCPSHLDRIPILKPALSVAFRESLDEFNLSYQKKVSKDKMMVEMLTKGTLNRQ